MIAGAALDIGDIDALLFGLQVAGYVAVFGLGLVIGWAMGSVSSAARCGCQACKAAAHRSDCAVHNAPALPVGACNCGANPT